MPSKKTIWLIIIGLAGLVLAYFYFSLPRITTNFLIAQTKNFGLKNLKFKVIHVGFQRLDLADITAGDAAAPALHIPDLSVEYSLTGLWRKKIKSIRLVGAWIKMEDRGQGLRFPGLITPPRALAQNGEMPTIERFILEDSKLHLAWEGRSLEIPIGATLRASGQGYSFSALLRPLAQTVRLQGTVDRNFTAAKITFTIPAIPLQALIDQAGFGSSVRGKGRIAAQGEIVMLDGGFKTAAVSVSNLGEWQMTVPDQISVMLDSFSLAFNIGSDFTARNIVGAVQGRQLLLGELAVESPFHLDIRGRQWPDLEFSVRALHVARPMPALVEHISGKISGPWTAAKINGGFRLQTGNRMLAVLGLPGEITRSYTVDGDFQGSLKTGNIAWTMQAWSTGNLTVAMDKDSLQGQLNLKISLNGDAQRLHANAAFRMPDSALQFAGFRAQAEMFSGDAELDYNFGGIFRCRGLLNISGGNVYASKGNGLEAAGIRLNMPWHWPGAGRSADGNFSIARLQSNGTRWQDLNGILIQKDMTLLFFGSMHSILPKIALMFQGQYALNPAGGSMQADFAVPPFVLPAKTALQSLHPMLQGMSGSGLFQAEGKIWTGNKSAGGNATLKIAAADFEQQMEKISLRGVNAEIRLVNLFDFVTAPAQRFGFRELQWQDMSFTNGELIFAGESNGTVFIESARFDWCGGKIIMAPFRLKSGATDFLMTFNCDRVNFARMLNALVGKTIVSGDAEMSGIIPLQLVKGSPVFLDGYLYSTPGRSGNLKVAKPELISNGQVLVEEAIRDFRYNWIKVKMKSINNRLDMAVSMDGAPARKLPLLYDQKQKNFIKDPSGGRHVELKGLLLDIHFSDIDLKDLLKASSQMTSSNQEK